MLITVYEYLNLFQEVCAPTQTVGEEVFTPPMFASMQVFVFEDNWVQDEFNPFWWEYLMAYRKERNQPLENNARRGNCDEITARCESQFSEAARKLMGDVDCSAGAKRTRIYLADGVSLNNVPGPGGHEMIVLATRPAGRPVESLTYKDVTLKAYEPQNRESIPLADAIARGVVVRAQWV